MTEKEVARVLGMIPRISRLGFADAVARGLPLGALERVKEAFRFSDREIANLVGVSDKTVSRLRKGPRRALSAVASDRLYRMARIFALAKEVFEDEDPAREWLRAPQPGMGNRVPLELLATEAGAREVEDLLGRIEHGVLS